MNDSPAACFVPVLVAIVVAWPVGAQASDSWVVIPFEAAGIDDESVETFTQILVLALREQGDHARLATDGGGCAERECALSSATSAGAMGAIFGSVRRLGERVHVLVTVVRQGRDGEESHRLTAASVDELDTVADRIAAAIATGRRVDATERLGTVLQDDVPADLRRKGDVGVTLRLGGAFPLGSSFAGSGPAFDVQTGFWFEATHFAIEARVGLRSAAFNGPRRTEGFRQGVLDIGGLWFPTSEAIGGFFGGGAGLRYFYAPFRVDDSIGSIIITNNARRRVAQGVAFGAYARVGVMLMRTWSTRVSVSADWDVTVSEVDQRKSQHLATMNLAVHF